MVPHSEQWLELRRFRALHEAGLSISEIARQTGLHRRTVRKYLAEDAAVAAPRPSSRAGTRVQVLSPFAHVIGDEVLAAALLDRLLHHCDVVAINGTSYRLKNRLTAIDGQANVT